MTREQIIQKTQGLLAGAGLALGNAEDGKYEILASGGRAIARGNLRTVYYAAIFVAADAKDHPEKYKSINATMDANEAFLAGRAMALKLNMKK